MVETTSVIHTRLGKIHLDFNGDFDKDLLSIRSVCLMMQTALPCLLFADGPSQLKLIGGTNTEFAPDIDYYGMVKKYFLLKYNMLKFLFIGNRSFNRLLNDLTSISI